MRLPDVNAPCPVNQRCPAAPAVWPLGEYVYQAKNTTGEIGLTSNTNPCPDVAGSNQFPESAKSPFVVAAVPVVHVTLGVMRDSGIVPLRPLPS